ncbi:MAG: hypothetical protein Q9167_000560 [Letrouitia subvulpina]
MSSAGAKDERALPIDGVFSFGEDLSTEKMTVEETRQWGQQKTESSVSSYPQQRPKLFANTNIPSETPISPTYRRQFYTMGAQPDTPLEEQKRSQQKNTERGYSSSKSTSNLFRLVPLQENPLEDWPEAEAEAGEGNSSNQASFESPELPIEEANAPNTLSNQSSVRRKNNKTTSNAARVENTELNRIKAQFKEEQKNFRRRIVKHMIDKRNMKTDHLQQRRSWENASRLKAQDVAAHHIASKWFPIREKVHKPKRVDDKSQGSEVDPPLYDDFPARIRQMTVDAWLLRADIAYAMQEWRAMELHSVTACELADGLGWQPFKAQCQMPLGKALYHMKDWEGAAEAFEAAKATDGYYVSESEITYWLEMTKMRLQEDLDAPVETPITRTPLHSFH